jgi:outer membrane protein OmpA-like peptidoglycan-associated protein
MAGETSGGSGTSIATSGTGGTAGTPRVTADAAHPTLPASNWVVTDDTFDLTAVDPASPFGEPLTAVVNIYPADQLGQPTVTARTAAPPATLAHLPNAGSVFIAPIAISAPRGLSLLVVDVVLGTSNKQTFSWRLDTRLETGCQIYPLGATGGALQGNVLRLLGTLPQSQQVFADTSGVHALAQAVVTVANTQRQATHTPFTFQSFAVQGQISSSGTGAQGAGGLQVQFGLPFTQIQTTPPAAAFSVSYDVLVNVDGTSVTLDLQTTPGDVAKLAYTVLFNIDKATFELVEGHHQLKDLYNWITQLKTIPNLADAIRLGYVPVHLTGNASSPTGTDEHNMLLSQQRCDAVRTALQGASANPVPNGTRPRAPIRAAFSVATRSSSRSKPSGRLRPRRVPIPIPRSTRTL